MNPTRIPETLAEQRARIDTEREDRTKPRHCEKTASGVPVAVDSSPEFVVEERRLREQAQRAAVPAQPPTPDNITTALTRGIAALEAHTNE